MILLSNNCFGGFIYKNILEEQYNSPFVWCRIWEDDYFTLIKDFENINFMNFEIHKTKENEKINDLMECNFNIIIDNKIKVFYNHYRFSSKDDKIRKDGIDIYYNKIWEYIVEKYKERTKRMLTDKTKPIILLHCQLGHYYNIQNDIIKLCNNKKYKYILLTNTNEIIKNENNLILPGNVLKYENPEHYTDYYKNEIKEFLCN